VRARALVSRQVRRGIIWMPLHFAEARANLLTNDAGDAVTGTGEYKVCAARMAPVAVEGESEGTGAVRVFRGAAASAVQR
jgi:predicted molibdopterin-dependent oxidoreductase YjgC